MKKNIFIMALIAMIACFAGATTATAQNKNQTTACTEAYYTKLAQKMEGKPYVEMMHDGVPSYKKYTGWFLGAGAGLNFPNIDGLSTTEPLGEVIIGQQKRGFHWELRAGVRQFKFHEETELGLHAVAGAFWDPIDLRKDWGISLGAFAGAQKIKYSYTLEGCDSNGKPITDYNVSKPNPWLVGAEVQIKKAIGYTNNLGLSLRGFVYQYDTKMSINGEAVSKTKTAVNLQVAVTFTFGLGRKVSYAEVLR